MPLYIPWLTETIKKRGVRYLLHHYLGQFFEEKLTLDQLSIDIYEGKGSIKNLNLNVEGLNDELDFIPFKFLDGCLIGQISVEVPWSSLATEACKVELDEAEFYCRIKTSADAEKHHCTESTLLAKSLMTSSMQMAEEIVTTEDDDESEIINQQNPPIPKRFSDSSSHTRTKDASQMFEGLEMFAQLIDSVLRRTKLTARNTVFQIKPQGSDDAYNDESDMTNSSRSSSDQRPDDASRSDCEEFAEPIAKSDTDDECHDDKDEHMSNSTVEFFIKFFRCEEMIDLNKIDVNRLDSQSNENTSSDNKSSFAIPETITKILTLEDVEMRINGLPVSNLVGKHTITIKFNGQKSEISIFSSSPLQAVINHRQLDAFFRVFDSSSVSDSDSNCVVDRNQTIMSPQDYAKIENQLLKSATHRAGQPLEQRVIGGLNVGIMTGSKCFSHQESAYVGGGRRWIEDSRFSDPDSELGRSYHPPDGSSLKPPNEPVEPSLSHIEAFSCELKLPGIWLCILRDNEALPPLIKPYADSINSFPAINKYIDDHIKVPHIRCLALKVALDITSTGINIFLGDLDISEYLEDNFRMNPVLRLLHNEQSGVPMHAPRYKATVLNGKEVTIELLTKTQIVIDPTIIDRFVYDYKIIKLRRSSDNLNKSSELCPGHGSRNLQQHRVAHPDFSLNLRANQFKVELLCPIPDLTPEAIEKCTQLRPQSFLFEFKSITVTWQSDKLTIISDEFLGFVKSQPKQSNREAVKFIDATCTGPEKIIVVLEPSPSNLDHEISNEIEEAINESSLYDSIYVGQACESRIPIDPFQMKRKVVRGSFQSQQPTRDKTSDYDHERILTPGDRQHLLDYLNHTVMFTKLSLKFHLPVCSIEFEDKEQLDLIYNRFGNDFVFWQPRCLHKREDSTMKASRVCKSFCRSKAQSESIDESDLEGDEDEEPELDDTADSEHSFHSMLPDEDSNDSTCYDNAITCQVIVDELFVKFNHQSCSAALKQDISVENFLMGVVIDVNKKPGTLLSIVAQDLELSTDLETVLEGNFFKDENSIFSLTAEIKRPTKSLKNIKLAVQLKNGLFYDIKTDTYTRFWQSINVTDEPILGYVAPQIVTELHVNILDTNILLARNGSRPALLSIDELYMTSMVVERTSQVMIRLIADEVSLYMKRDRRGLEVMKNYICLIDSGLIDLNVKFGEDGRLEFGVINNVITVRVCQDSLSALCKLFTVLVKNTNQTTRKKMEEEPIEKFGDEASFSTENSAEDVSDASLGEKEVRVQMGVGSSVASRSDGGHDLLIDAMKDYETDCFQATASQAGCSSDAVGHGEFDIDSESAKRAVMCAEAMSDGGDYRIESDVIGDKVKKNRNQDNSKEQLNVSQRANSAPQHSSNLEQTRDVGLRDPNACLLDESNPMLGDLFSPPLVPSIERADSDGCLDEIGSSRHSSQINSFPMMDESGFFVIGDDDVGAGVIDKKLQEPVVRMLTNEPIAIIDNHFKMTRPRTIPEMLAASMQRYVLEEMTLVVYLYGGRDFDDEDFKCNDSAGCTAHSSNTADFSSEPATDLIETTSADGRQIRSRTSRVAGTRRQTSTDLGGKCVRRRKHLSESCGGQKWETTCSKSSEMRVRFGEGAVNLWESLDLMSAPDFLGTRSRPSQHPPNINRKQAGGTWREDDVCIQLTLSKIKLLFELADVSHPTSEKLSSNEKPDSEVSPPIAWRFMLFIQEIEIKDKIVASDINKMLYEYSTESMPKRSTQMLAIKNIATVNPTDGCEECDLRVSLKPLRLNIDQDTLLFLIEFCTSFYKSLSKQQPITHSSGQPSGGSKTAAKSQHSQSQIIDKVGSLSTQTNRADGQAPLRKESVSAGSASSTPSSTPSTNDVTVQKPVKTTVLSNPADLENNIQPAQLPIHCHSDNLSASPNEQAIYIKSFTFSPDVPIRIDYHAKHLDFEQGALAGILMGLAHLDHSELVLRRVQAKHGMRGLDRVLVFVLNSWLSDIKRNQLPSILGGVGPMHSVIQLFQGMRDLVWMPIDHYRKDGRLVRGLQRGASSFSSSTAMAAINLVNRFISIVQCTAQVAHDIVTPPSLSSNSTRRLKQLSGIGNRHPLGRGSPRTCRSRPNATGLHSRSDEPTCLGPRVSNDGGLNQPRNFCEGVAVGFTILKEGFNDTARNVTVGMQAEDMRSAVGELVRQIPSTLLNPIISATEGAQSVLVGIRNQIAPDARREDQEKWKGRIRGK